MQMIRQFIRLVFIGTCAVALQAQTLLLLGKPISPDFLQGFVFGGAVFGYHCTQPVRWVRVLAWTAGFAGAACFLGWVMAGGNILAALVPVVFWLAYYGFQRPGNQGLRTRLLAKPITVAFAWAWVTVLLPIDSAEWGKVWWMFLERSAFVLALALAYDVSDEVYDRRFQLTTLAHRLSGKSIFLLINLGLASSGVFVCLGLFFGVYSQQMAVSLLLFLLFSGWWVHFLLQKNAWHSWHKVLIDGLMLLQCALVLLLR
jgi:4-hydroxybenzoate polyprenyltransferase